MVVSEWLKYPAVFQSQTHIHRFFLKNLYVGTYRTNLFLTGYKKKRTHLDYKETIHNKLYKWLMAKYLKSTEESFHLRQDAVTVMNLIVK